MRTLIDAIHKRDAELQKILGSMENKKVFNKILLWLKVWWQDTQRQLLWNSPWKDAQGDDLPEYDREVIVLIKYDAQLNIYDEEYPTCGVGFGHRPNPNGWDGKSLRTGKVEHYTPKTYDKGGWNIPNIVYWLDVELPKEIEL